MLRWSQNGFSMVRQCFQTYWERSTNSVCIENILIQSCNERNILVRKFVPFKTNFFISIMFEHGFTKIRISQEAIVDPFKMLLDASLFQIMGLMIFFLFWSFPISVAMRSSLLNHVVWNWEKVQCILDDASVDCTFFQEMPANAIDDAFAPVW